MAGRHPVAELPTPWPDEETGNGPDEGMAKGRLCQPELLWGGQREFGLQGGACAGGGVYREVAAECLGPVFESDQAGSAGGVGAASAVVADADLQHGAGVVFGGVDGDVDGGGVGVFGGVGRGLGHEVVGGDFDLFGQPSVGVDVQFDRDGAAAGECVECGG
jgi:hypothetical protein